MFANDNDTDTKITVVFNAKKNWIVHFLVTYWRPDILIGTVLYMTTVPTVLTVPVPVNHMHGPKIAQICHTSAIHLRLFTSLPPPALKIGLISSAVGIFWTIYLSPKKWLNWNEDEDPKFQSSVCGEEGWQIFWLKSKVGIFIAPAPHFFGPVIFLFIWYIPTDGPIKEVSCFVAGGKSECFDGRLIQSELPPPPLMTLSHLAQDSGWQRCCPKYPGRCQKGWKTNVATGQEGSVVQTTVYAARLDFWGSFYAAAKP